MKEQFFDSDEQLDREVERHLLHTHLQGDPYALRLLGKLDALNRGQNASVDTVAVMRALYYVRRIYQGQTHYSGASLYAHVLELASITANYRCNTEAIVTALFYDIEAKPDFTLAMVEDEFGLVIAEKVACFTTPIRHEDPVFRALDYQQREDQDVHTIQLCHQLCEMRTVGCLAPEAQRQKAAAILRDFLFLTMQLGLPAIEQELSQLCYQVLCPHKSRLLLPQYAPDPTAVLPLAFQVYVPHKTSPFLGFQGQ